jgi:hypothetical protein
MDVEGLRAFGFGGSWIPEVGALRNVDVWDPRIRDVGAFRGVDIEDPVSSVQRPRVFGPQALRGSGVSGLRGGLPSGGLLRGFEVSGARRVRCLWVCGWRRFEQLEFERFHAFGFVAS